MHEPGCELVQGYPEARCTCEFRNTRIARRRPELAKVQPRRQSPFHVEFSNGYVYFNAIGGTWVRGPENAEAALLELAGMVDDALEQFRNFGA